MRITARFLLLSLVLPFGMNPLSASAKEGDVITLFTKFTRKGEAACVLQLVAREIGSSRTGGAPPVYSLELLRTYIGKPESVTVLARSQAMGIAGTYAADAVVDEASGTVYFVQSTGRGFSIISVPLDPEKGQAPPQVAAFAAVDKDRIQHISRLTIYLQGDTLQVDAIVSLASGDRRLEYSYSREKRTWIREDELKMSAEDVFPHLKQNGKAR